MVTKISSTTTPSPVLSVLDKSANVSHNRVYTVDGNSSICGQPWSRYFNGSYAGRDVGSTLHEWPSDRQLVEWAEALLDFEV